MPASSPQPVLTRAQEQPQAATGIFANHGEPGGLSAADLHVVGAPEGIRTPNLLIRRAVLAVISGADGSVHARPVLARLAPSSGWCAHVPHGADGSVSNLVSNFARDYRVSRGAGPAEMKVGDLPRSLGVGRPTSSDSATRLRLLGGLPEQQAGSRPEAPRCSCHDSSATWRSSTTDGPALPLAANRMLKSESAVISTLPSAAARSKIVMSEAPRSPISSTCRATWPAATSAGTSFGERFASSRNLTRGGPSAPRAR